MQAMRSGKLCQFIESARVGVEDAVRSLLCELEPFLLQHAVRLTANCKLSPDWRHQSASDLLQETRLRIWKGITQFRGADDEEGMESCLRAWIIVVMQRAFLDMIEEKRLPPAEGPSTNGAAHQRHNGFVDLPTLVDLPSTDPTPSRSVSIDERAERVRSAVRELADAEDRFIIEQYFFRGQSLRSIAAGMEMEYTKLRRRFNRILSILGRALEDV
jgi:RNA polymerase sigma factor (sigma-70 family)